MIHRRWFRIVVGAALLCGIGFLPVRADDVEIHYAPDENLERIDVDLIRLARAKIDMAVYSLTDWAVIDALIEARRRGVALRIVLDPGQRHALDRLRPIADDVRMKPAGAYMHLKSYAVDGRLLRSGSANLSASGLKQQDNDLVVLRDPSAAKSFEARFQQLWVVSGPLPNSAAYAEPASKDTPTPAKDCAIKGNVNRKGEKIFHVPGSRATPGSSLQAPSNACSAPRPKRRQRGGGQRRENSDGARTGLGHHPCRVRIPATRCR